MSAGGGRALACGDFLIRRACRRLPESVRELELEWAGELPVILTDPAVRFAWLRIAKMLLFAGGVIKVAHRMPVATKSGRAGIKPKRPTAAIVKLCLAVMATMGLGLTGVLVSSIVVFHHLSRGGWFGAVVEVVAMAAATGTANIAWKRYTRYVRSAHRRRESAR